MRDMHDPEQTIDSACNKLSLAGARYGVAAFPWATLIDIVLKLLEDCGKEAVKKTPFLARVRLTNRLRAAGVPFKDLVAVRETIMAAALAATDDEFEALGEINL